MSDDSAQQRRTAAATAARMRQGDERRAAVLREHGWTVVAPGEPMPTDGQLVARVRRAAAGPGRAQDAPWMRVAVIGTGQAAAGGRPRANLDGFGDRALTSFFVPGDVPQPDALRSLNGLTEALAGQGFRVAGAWTAGTDRDGRFVAAPVATVGRTDVEQG